MCSTFQNNQFFYPLPHVKGVFRQALPLITTKKLLSPFLLHKIISYGKERVLFSSFTQSCLTLCNPMDCGITNSWSLFKLMSIELVMPSNNFILCHTLFLPPSIFPTSWYFPMRQFFTLGGQSTGVSFVASFLTKNTQG